MAHNYDNDPSPEHDDLFVSRTDYDIDDIFLKHYDEHVLDKHDLAVRGYDIQLINIHEYDRPAVNYDNVWTYDDTGRLVNYNGRSFADDLDQYDDFGRPLDDNGPAASPSDDAG